MSNKSDVIAVKEEILNRSFFAFALLGIPTLASSLFRMHYSGWEPVFLFQIISVVFLLIACFFRKKIPLPIKVFFLNVVAMVAGLWGAYTWGLSGGWLILLTLPPIVFSVFYGKYTGLASILSASAILSLIAILYLKSGAQVPAFGKDNSFVFMVNAIVTYLFLTSPMVVLVGETGKFLESYIRKLKIKSEDLEQSNLRVKEINKKLLKAKRKAEESDRLKAHFLENISHEIRTPLNGILGFSEILKQGDLPVKERHFYSDFVFNNGRKFLSILDNVIYLAELAAGNEELKQEWIDLKELMHGLENAFRSDAVKKGLGLIVQTPKGDRIEEIISDKGKITKVLSELLSNAIKFTDKGDVTFGYDFENNSRISFFVKDTGIGISSRKKRIIFEHFMQGDPMISKKYGGAGMGLAITKLIAGLLNADVTVDSKMGEGSVFTFSLGLAETEMRISPKFSAVS